MIKKPIKLQSINTAKLERVCQSYINALEKGAEEEVLDTREYNICKEALETIFGRGVWDYIEDKVT